MPLKTSSSAVQAQADLIQLPLLSFRKVTKRFGATCANDTVTFDVEGGGIHAIVGENGAGKSTLSKILYGYYRPDEGVIALDGREISHDSPSAARRNGIGMVHQQLALVPSLSGFENVILGDPQLPFALNKSRLEKQVSAKAQALGFKLNLNCPVSELGIAERQKLEIFKLLWREARVLILDEPTSQLTPFEADEVLTIARDLARSGRIVILITHHITEVLNYAERITVLRRGKCIKTLSANEATSEELARLMIDGDAEPSRQAHHDRHGKPLVALKDLSLDAGAGRPALHDINLTIHAGEIVGIAGISGSGQTELGMLLAGLLPPSKGNISYEEGAPGKSIDELVAYIPSEQKIACVPALSVAANCYLKEINKASEAGKRFLNTTLMESNARTIIDSFKIVPKLSDIPAGALSGGNLQRLIIGRELATGARLLVADNPCAGLDATMSIRIRQALREQAIAGRGIVLISPDLEELLLTCDRIIAIFNGRLSGEQEAGSFSYQSLAASMGGS